MGLHAYVHGVNPTDASWWWGTASEGLLGGVIGGIATGGAVWLTIRHERRRSQADALEREIGRLFEKTRRLRTLLAVQSGEFALENFDWSVDVTVVTQATAEREPCFSALLQTCNDQAGAALGTMSVENGRLEVSGSVQVGIAAVASAERVLQRRLFTPDYFKMSKDECDWVAKAIRGGAFV